MYLIDEVKDQVLSLKVLNIDFAISLEDKVVVYKDGKTIRKRIDLLNKVEKIEITVDEGEGDED